MTKYLILIMILLCQSCAFSGPVYFQENVERIGFDRSGFGDNFVNSRCKGKPLHITAYRDFLDILVSTVTLGIYAPTTAVIVCDSGKGLKA